jgi:hypothetical protein
MSEGRYTVEFYPPSGPESVNVSDDDLATARALQHEVAFATGQRLTARAAGYRAINSFRPGFGLDDLIECLAVRTGK